MKNIFVSKKDKIIDVSKISSIEPNKKIGENYCVSCCYNGQWR